jgi:nitrate reductase gamma subunit
MAGMDEAEAVAALRVTITVVNCALGAAIAWNLSLQVWLRRSWSGRVRTPTHPCTDCLLLLLLLLLLL